MLTLVIGGSGSGKSAFAEQKIVSFAVLRGASQYTARETDFWSQILTWIRAGYRLQ